MMLRWGFLFASDLKKFEFKQSIHRQSERNSWSKQITFNLLLRRVVPCPRCLYSAIIKLDFVVIVREDELHGFVVVPAECSCAVSPWTNVMN